MTTGETPALVWRAGPPKSEIRFSLRHLLFTQMLGQATRWKAFASFDFEVPSRSWVDVVVDATSLETGDPERDEHIRSAEFLDTRSFPEIRFSSREVTAHGEGNRWSVAGDLTIRSVTMPATIELERDGGAWGSDIVPLKGWP